MEQAFRWPKKNAAHTIFGAPLLTFITWNYMDIHTIGDKIAASNNTDRRQDMRQDERQAADNKTDRKLDCYKSGCVIEGSFAKID